MKKQYIKFLSLIATSVLTTANAYFSFDELEKEMTEQERKRTGINKLSAKERQFIENWLQNNKELYHTTAPTVSDAANIKWMYESMRVLNPSPLKEYDESKFPFQIAVCAYFQNDASLLKEWLDHHIRLGCEHFYLYNKMSQDNYLEVLSPYIKNGLVELIEWPSWNEKDQIFQNGIAVSQKKTKWLICLSVKESVNVSNDRTLTSCLKEFERYDKVLLKNSFIIKPHKIPVQDQSTILTKDLWISSK